MQFISDKLLFTPGPLTTSQTVKGAMLRDLGSRDTEFIDEVKFIREGLLAVAGVSAAEGYQTVIIQGSGTFGIESVISSAIPADGHLLVVINGVYGERISSIAAVHNIAQTRLVFPENEVPDPEMLKRLLLQKKEITHVAVIHCETTTGIFNPVEAIGEVCKEAGVICIVDAMSSFGAVPLDIKKAGIDFLISSSNKCIEGVPGFSFVIAREYLLRKCEQQARTLTLDLYAQWKGLETDGQFRFTPPTHVMLAFAQALRELEQEGGVQARAARYRANYALLSAGMCEMGFREYLEPANRGYIITSFLYPDDPAFSFKQFYASLSDKGFVIYPGKLSQVNCFRIGNIGHLPENAIVQLLDAIRETVIAQHIHLSAIVSGK